MKFSNALRWSFFSELTSKAIQPIVYLVLARILLPEDFGVVSAAIMIIAFSQIFTEAGLGKALIQRQEGIQESAIVAFWMNITFGCIASTILFVSAEFIGSRFFQDVRVGSILKVMTLQIILASISSVHTALLQKDLQYRKLFWIRLVTIGAPGVASIPLALYGTGYWALVIGSLIGQLLQTVVLWRLSNWRPKLAFSYKVAGSVGKFASWSAFSGLLGWFYMWADSLIVGMSLGVSELGQYRLATMISTSVAAVCVAPIIPVAYSKFSKDQLNKKAVIRSVILGEKAISLILYPISILFFMYGHLLVTKVLGDGWEQASTLVPILVLSGAFSYSISLRQECYRVFNIPNIESMVMLVSMIIRLPVYIFAVNHGLLFFVIAKTISILIGVINHLVFSKIFLGISYSEYIKTQVPVFLISLCAAFFILLFRSRYIEFDHIYREALVAISGFAYLGCIIFCERLFIGSVIKKSLN